MFEFLSPKKQTQSDASHELSDSFLNQAMCAYVETFSNRKRLVEFMERADMLDRLPIVEASLKRALKETEDFLWAQKDGVRWNETFERELYCHVRQCCPWLDEEGFAPLRSFSGWLCWHEGLNA
jgi:hypothetical protein